MHATRRCRKHPCIWHKEKTSNRKSQFPSASTSFSSSHTVSKSSPLLSPSKSQQISLQHTHRSVRSTWDRHSPPVNDHCTGGRLILLVRLLCRRRCRGPFSRPFAPPEVRRRRRRQSRPRLGSSRRRSALSWVVCALYPSPIFYQRAKPSNPSCPNIETLSYPGASLRKPNQGRNPLNIPTRCASTTRYVFINIQYFIYPASIPSATTAISIPVPCFLQAPWQCSRWDQRAHSPPVPTIFFLVCLSRVWRSCSHESSF